MSCNTPKKDDSAEKGCGGGCHGKDSFEKACTKKADPAPQTPAETPKNSGCCGDGGPAKGSPCCKP